MTAEHIEEICVPHKPYSFKELPAITDPIIIAERLDAIYRRIPDVRCKGMCAENCGPILCGKAEWSRILPIAGRVGRVDANLNCPLLKDERCTVYAIRPLICRLWGAVKAMQCPHGCKPDKWMSDVTAGALLSEVMDISGGEAAGPGLTLILAPHAP